MQTRRIAFTALAAALLALPATLSAQSAVPVPPAMIGKWTGTVTPPGEETVVVTFDVTTNADTVKMTLDGGERGRYDASDIQLTEQKISFTFVPGPKVLCVLYRKDDGTFAGQCSPDGSDGADITMVPPRASN